MNLERMSVDPRHIGRSAFTVLGPHDLPKSSLESFPVRKEAASADSSSILRVCSICTTGTLRKDTGVGRLVQVSVRRSIVPSIPALFARRRRPPI
jgi:hypothetical protein